MFCIQKSVYTVHVNVTSSQLHCNKIPIYVFLFWELRGLSPNFYIHVFVSDLYIPRIGQHILLKQNRQIDLGNISIAHRYMNVEIGTVATQFLFWEFLFQIFCIVSLQCGQELLMQKTTTEKCETYSMWVLKLLYPAFTKSVAAVALD